MLIAYLVDIHGAEKPLSLIIKALKDMRPDIIIVGGDITDFAPLTTAERILRMIEDRVNSPVYFVPGNCDDPALLNWEGKNIYNLHSRKYEVGDVELAGLGGSNKTPFHTNIEWTEEEIRRILEKIGVGERTVLVTHCPPHGTKLDKAMKIKHVGSKELRKYIEQRQPKLVLTGHIHESTGMDKIGKTTIVNPGPAKRKRYAIIELGEELKVMIHKL